VLDFYLPKIKGSTVLKKLDLKEGKYFVVSAHREENVDDLGQLTQLVKLLNTLADRFQEPIIVSTHPRTRARLDALKANVNPLIQFHKPFGFFDYVALQASAHCALSDSGTITEESSILNFPALNIRQVHERPEGFEEAAVMMVGMDIDRVLQGLAILENQPRGEQRLLSEVQDYAVTNVSDKVLRIIQSYTNFVKQKTWKQY
jgi:UDP-N-acetylglucosamine 2-epimerase (non-hydrolysing)